MSPLQCGIGVADAVHSVGTALRQCRELLKSDSGIGILQIDLKNAFNSVSREPILEFVKCHLPKALAWVQWMFSSKVPLFCADQVIVCSTGVQQGDPLGPLLFAAGIHKILEEVKNRWGAIWSVWYLDDGSIMGRIEDLNDILAYLEERFGHIGLVVNFDK